MYIVYIHTYIYTHTHTYIHTYIYTYIFYACMNACRPMYLYVCVRACVRVHAYVYVCMCRYVSVLVVMQACTAYYKYNWSYPDIMNYINRLYQVVLLQLLQTSNQMLAANWHIYQDGNNTSYLQRGPEIDINPKYIAACGWISGWIRYLVRYSNTYP